MYQKPSAAKRLYFDVIPRTVDDYLSFLDAYPRQEAKERLGNPVWHIHGGAAAARDSARRAPTHHLRHAAQSRDGGEQRRPRSCSGAFCAVMRRMFHRSASAARPARAYAVRYYRDFVRPAKSFTSRRNRARGPRKSVRGLADPARGRKRRNNPDALYDVARKIPRYQDLKAKAATLERPGVSNDWFTMLYRVLLGESRGPASALSWRFMASRKPAS